jgi:hypothetical protein
MAVLSTSRHNLLLRDLCQRLLRAGKPKKVALPAVMRKLLICLNVLLRQQPEQQDFFLQGPQQPSRSTRGEVQEKKRNKHRRPSAASYVGFFLARSEASSF